MSSFNQVFKVVVEGRWAKRLVNAVAMPSQRKEQERLDFKRLYKLTRIFEEQKKGGQTLSKMSLQYMMMEAEQLAPQQHRAAVEESMTRQLLHVSTCIHEALKEAGDGTPAAARLEAAAAARLAKAQEEDRPAVQRAFLNLKQKARQGKQGEEEGATAPSTSGRDQAAAAAGPGGAVLSQAAVSQALQRRLGYSLRVGRSEVAHPEAGQGLFLQGSAPPGALLAIFPGVAYSRTQYARMPGYPKVDLGNPYLSTRWDLTLLDSKPWGRGDPGPADEGSAPAPKVPPPPGSSSSTAGSSGSSSSSSSSWVHALNRESSHLGLLEGRHPLALAHWANHPGRGGDANVVEVAVDVHLGEEQPPWLRAYLPCLPPLDECSEEDLLSGGPGSPAPLLLLVASRAVKDGEELLQNYRLNPHVARPDWYHPLTPDEEQRRWARLPLLDLIGTGSRRG